MIYSLLLLFSSLYFVRTNYRAFKFKYRWYLRLSCFKTELGSEMVLIRIIFGFISCYGALNWTAKICLDCLPLDPFFSNALNRSVPNKYIRY